jgi:hypothetical protein
MREVQLVSCVNGGGFLMRFRVAVAGDDNDSDFTSDFPNPEYKTINTKDMGLAEGTEIWPHLDLNLGDTRTGTKVRYKRNGQVAVYSVTGGTRDAHIDLIGGND